MEHCKSCGNILDSNKKKCKICRNAYLDYCFCEGCIHVEDILFNFIGKRYCIPCWIILNESKEEAENNRDSIGALSKYIDSGNIPDEVLVDQTKILSLTDSMKHKRTPEKKRESNYEKLPEGYDPNDDYPKKFVDDYEKAYELQLSFLITDDHYNNFENKDNFSRINPRPYENFPPPRINYPNQNHFKPANPEKDLYPAPFEVKNNSSACNKNYNQIPNQLVNQLPPKIPQLINQELNHPPYIPPQFTQAPSIPPQLNHPPYIPAQFSQAPSIPSQLNRPQSIPPPLKLGVNNPPNILLPINQLPNYPSSNPPPLNLGSNYPPPILPSQKTYNCILENKISMPTETTQNYNNNTMNTYYNQPIYEEKANILSKEPNHLVLNPSITPSAPTLPPDLLNLPPNSYANSLNYSIPSTLPNLDQSITSINYSSIPPPLPKEVYQPPPISQLPEFQSNIPKPPPLISSQPTQNPDILPILQLPQNPNLKNNEEIKTKPLPIIKKEQSNNQQAKNIRISVFIPTQFKSTDPLKEFKLHKRIGNGSSGEIHIAEKILTKEIFAAKIITPKADNEKELVINEISLTQNSNHPNIIKYLEFYDHKHSIWIIEELMSCSLADLILDCPGKIPEHIFKYALYEVLKGLNYLHRRNRIHRDIKSDNILISENGDIKIADLGFAAQLDDVCKARNTLAGTLLWMPPEILQKNNYGIKADIWSLGIVAIELAEGEPPHYTETQHCIISRIINQCPPELKEKDRWSLEFCDFVGKCLVKDPSCRKDTDELLRHSFFIDAEIHKQSFVKYFYEWSNSR
ncbi:hypothetical protein SteCoe_4308 [Stentor coeruleus]|uniref:Protein kinase domain-containing protein n=1 Tax=Stentor coeruleus TaxID=5963 RepID=A0A1R2CV12_9CILI|nr:hypothetical protein SteCoe_4308 [Stentor coeruleus]